MYPRTLRIAVLSAAITASGGFLLAGVLSGGLFQIFKSLVQSAGGSAAVSGGAFSLSHSVGQPNARSMSGGAFTMVSGYHVEPGVLALAPAVANAAIPGPQVINGAAVGVALGAVLTVTFTQAMDAATVTSAASVTALRDSAGNPVQISQAVSLSYDAVTFALTVTPSASWDFNTVYAFAVSTAARNASGVPLGTAFNRPFQTIFDNAQPNVITDPSGAAIVTLAPNSVPNLGYAVMEDDPINDPDQVPPDLVREANSKIVADLGAFKTPVAIREINLYDTSNNPVPVSAPVGGTIAFEYQDDGQGYVAGTSPRVRARTLAVWVLDETLRLWVRIPGSSVDTASQRVTAPLPHLSVFALIGDLDTDVSQVFAFPVPWKPRASNPSRYGTLGGGITFSNLPSEGAIRVYTVSGDLVNEIAIPPGALTVKWTGTNASGSEVASGVYLWEIRSGSNRKTGKLMVVW